MPSVSDFKKSLKDKSDDELNELINTTRNNRVSSGDDKKQDKNTKQKTKSSSTSEDPDSFGDLSPEEAQDLLNRLKNG